MSIEREKIIKEKDGKKYTGYYKVEKGHITVYGGLYSKTTQVGTMNREGIRGLAELLMSELINERKIEPKE